MWEIVSSSQKITYNSYRDPTVIQTSKRRIVFNMATSSKYWLFVLIFVFAQCICDKSNESKDRLSNEAHNIKISNSYSDLYEGYNINYSYFEKSQIHDYSGNWDLDGDGILDRVIFVGDNSAHLKYRLLVYISSIDDFIFLPYLNTDMPIYIPKDSLIKNDSELPFFSVNDFNDDGINDIYFNLINDNYLSDTLKLRGIETTTFILYYNNKKKAFNFRDYIQN